MEAPSKGDDLNDENKALGKRHIRYGVKPHHSDAVIQAMLWTLQHSFGRDWNDNIRDAWKACYTTLSQMMHTGHVRKLQNKE